MGPKEKVAVICKAHIFWSSLADQAQEVWSRLEQEDLPWYAAKYPWDDFDFLFTDDLNAKYRAHMLVAVAARRVLEGYEC